MYNNLILYELYCSYLLCYIQYYCMTIVLDCLTVLVQAKIPEIKHEHCKILTYWKTTLYLELGFLSLVDLLSV